MCYKAKMCLLYMCAVLFLLHDPSVYSTFEPDNPVPCGPDFFCECTSNEEMDCSYSDVKVRDACEYVNSATHSNLTRLRIDSLTAGIEMLTQDDLNGCQELVEIHMRNNHMNAIDTGAFRGFQRLEILDISNNNLDVYHAHPSKKITFPAGIKELNLIGNYNMSMYDDLSYPNLSDLVELQSLFLDGLPFIDFDILYRSLRNLNSVTLSGLLGNCNISSVTNATFIHLPYVQYLNISACNITDIDAFGFGALSNLESLDLSWNMRLGFQAVKNVTYGLQYTNLRVFNISKIHTTFGPGTRVRVEDICYLYNTSLTELDISRNRIEFFENNALAVTPDTLNIVNIEYNKFTFRPYLLQLGCLKNMTEFYGSFQNFAYSPLIFDDEFQGLNDRNYDQSDDKCPHLKEALSKSSPVCPYFEPGEKIEIINYLPVIPKTVRRIELAQSDLIYEVGNMILMEPSDQLEYIDMSGNVLSSWKGPFRAFKHLKHLDLSKNYISYVDRNVFTFVRNSLENLQIQNNFIGMVFNDKQNGPFIFNNFTELKTLNLSFNIISDIPSNLLLGSHKVKTLDLSVNNIEKWTLDVSQFEHLLNLILRSNFIQTLPMELLHRLEDNAKQNGEQFSIDLRNNTIQVDCDRKEFLHWLVKHQNNMLEFEEYTFKDSNGDRLTKDEFERNVSQLDKQCRSNTGIYIASVAGGIVLLIFVVSGLIYKYRWKLTYMLRYAKLKGFGFQPIDGINREYKFDIFLSYANENSNFIVHHVYPRLVQKGYTVSLHEKDFIPGNNIADNILEAIADSRMTLAFLSNDYLTSKWCMYEFRMAREESRHERDDVPCLLLVLFDDVSKKKMPSEMLKWLNNNTYIEYTTDERGEALFWENLERAVKTEP